MSDEAIINEINEILVYLEDEGKYLLDKDCDTEWLLAVKEVLNLFNQQQERIEELEIITGLANNRKYYRKFVDEVFCKQKGNELSEPDFDYIYQLYFEQQAEIERLKWEKDHFEFKVDDLNGKLEKFKEYRDIKNEAYEREIEKLRAENERLNGNLFAIRNACMQRRNEAIKEFAERLKETQKTFIGDEFAYEYIPSIEIDVLLLEMVGGENA